MAFRGSTGEIQAAPRCEDNPHAGAFSQIGIFLLAGAAEIAGGWLVWQWLRVDRPLPFGVAGAAVLVSYGVIATLQREPEFGRVYAAYGGIFIALSLLWGMVVDGWWPDRWDLAGAALAIAGMAVMMFGPRSS